MDDILQRAKELKDELTDFVFDAEGELAVALETFSAQQMSQAGQPEMNQRNLLVDRFISEGKVGEKTPIALFLDQPQLSPSDRQLVSRWEQSFIGLFEITQILADGFELMNWTTAKHYRVKPNNPQTLENMARYKVGEILLTQIAPVSDTDWMFSSACTTLGRLGKPKLAVAIGNFKQNYKNNLYSDAPDLLTEAWKSVEQYHQEFIDFFGSDEVTLPGYKLNQKLTEFQAIMTEKRLEASGVDSSKSLKEMAEEAGVTSEEIESLAEEMGVDAKTTAKLFESNQKAKMVQPQVELPAHLKKAEQVTVLSHPHWGQNFLPTYHQFKNLLEAEDWKSIDNSEKLVRQYLESPEMSVFIWQRLAQQYPTQLESLLKEFLDRPEFSLEKDLPSLMQQYNKPLEPDLPEIASVPLHLHTLFQDAILEVNKNKSKNKVSKKQSGKGFKK